MSSQGQASSETTRLLGDSTQARQPSRSRSRVRFRCSVEILLIPVALATRLAPLIASTTIIDLVRQVVCWFWNISRGDPTTFPVGGAISPELCNAPEVERYFAIVTAILSAMEGILSMTGCGILSYISSHHGRKPALLLVLIAGTVGNYLIPGSQYTPDWLAGWLFMTGLLLEMFSTPALFSFLVNMYIVDECNPEDRTAALSKMGGWGALGTCISYALGGYITTRTGNPLIVFHIAAAIFLATFIYVISVLPESFTKEKRDALSHVCSETPIDGHPTTSWLIFEPLKMLVPTRNLDGTRNWRLAWIATHNFVYMAATSYAAPALIVLVTSKYGLTPADTGLFLTVLTVSGTIFLVLIIPPLVCLLRPYYRRKGRVARPLYAGIDLSGGDEELESETSDNLDVHLAAASCVIAGIFYLCAAGSTTIKGLVSSGICIGLSFLHAPTIQSLAAGSVDPPKQGEALAAIEIVSSAAGVLSPIIMGSILTATINTVPLLLFYIHLAVVVLSSGLLFFVKDTDRYRRPYDV